MSPGNIKMNWRKMNASLSCANRSVKKLYRLGKIHKTRRRRYALKWPMLQEWEAKLSMRFKVNVRRISLSLQLNLAPYSIVAWRISRHLANMETTIATISLAINPIQKPYRNLHCKVEKWQIFIHKHNFCLVITWRKIVGKGSLQFKILQLRV